MNKKQSNALNTKELPDTRAELESALRKYEELYDSAPVGYFTLTCDSIIHRVNLTGAQLLRLEQKQLIGKPLRLFLTAESISIFNAFLSILFASKHKETCVVEFRGDGSGSLWAYIEANVLENGEECYAMMVDITERKRVEEALRESEERFHSLYENSTIGLYRTNPEGKILLANPTLVAMLGFSSFEELRKRDLSKEDSEPGYTREEFIELIEKTGEVKGLEVAWKRRDGSIIYVRESAKAIKDPNGITLYYDGTVEDITERKKTEKALQQSEYRLKLILDTTDDGMLAVEGNGKVIITNKRFAELWRIPKLLIENGDDDAILNFAVDQLVNPEEFQSKVRLLNRSMDTDRDTLHFKDGRVFERYSAPLLSGESLIGRIWLFHDITQRKQAEEALRESEERFKNIFEHSTVGKTLTSLDGTININNAYCQIVGYTKDELLKLKWQAITHPDDVERDQKIFNSILSGEHSTARWEKRYIHKNGSIVWVDISTSLERDNDNKPLYFITTINDITESKLAEHRLLASEARYRRLFEAARDGILILDAETGVIVDANPFLVDLLGFSHTEFLGKSIWDIGFLKDIISNKEKFLELQQKEYVRYDNLPIETNDGRKIYVEFVSNIYLVDNQKVLQCNIRNITERVKAENELHTLAYALRSISECVSITELDNTLLFINEAFLKTYGYEQDELLGKNISIVDSPGNPDEVQRKINSMTLRGSWHGELLNRKKDGSEFPISLSTSIIRDDKGIPVALIGVATDITESKGAEDKRKILETQLQQAQKLESLGTLASGIAHDFNNILAIMIGHASLLEHSDVDHASIKKNSDTIINAGMRGASLVKQLLTFARKSDILIEVIRLNDIVAEISKLLVETFPKTITCSLKLEKPLPLMTADATQIHQVLLNLCVNARDAMPDGGTLSITTFVKPGELVRVKFPKANAKQYIGLRISDTGTGMDEATRLRIFEPFFTTKEIGRGTGLGLSIVFGIVESHNGFIDVQSEPGNGTAFEIYFPVPLEFVDIEEVKERSSTELAGGSETILLVEDEEMLRGLIKRLLESKGYTVVVAKDGNEAVEQYQQHQNEIRLVLSDFGLPKLNGFEVFKCIKNINPTIKFILASGFIDPEAVSDMLIAGIKDIIQKPYSTEKMLRSVRTILDLK